jgi:hypothetical protein
MQSLLHSLIETTAGVNIIFHVELRKLSLKKIKRVALNHVVSKGVENKTRLATPSL